jgi:predicted MFS family arabinose efflux permease
VELRQEVLNGPARGVASMQLLTIPLMALVPFVGSLGLGVGLLFVRNTLSQSGGPLCNEFSMGGLHAKDKPLVSGGLFFAFNLMWFVGNVVGGWMMESSFTTPYLLAAVLYAAGAALTYLLWVPAADEHVEAEPEHELALAFES